VIYLWLLASAGFGLIKRDTDPGWDAPRWPLFVSLAIGASWIPVALVAPVLSTILIWVMLAGALLALRAAPLRDWPWLALPLGLYAGWLTAASCVALATVAVGYGLGSVTVLSWIGVALALIIAVTMTQGLPRAHLSARRRLGAGGDRGGQRDRGPGLRGGRARWGPRHAVADAEGPAAEALTRPRALPSRRAEATRRWDRVFGAQGVSCVFSSPMTTASTRRGSRS
jgi:hypothetical protein